MKTARTKTLTGVSILLVCSLIGGSFLLQNSRLASAAGETSCTVKDFVATIREGPDKGWYVHGDLNLKIAADGAVTGNVTTSDEKKTVMAGVLGQITGRAVNLAFDLGKPADPKEGNQEYYLFGNGVIVNLPSDCKGPMGGLFAGPQPGDIGDWGPCDERPGLPKPIPCIQPSPPEPLHLPTLFPPLPK